MTFEDIDPGRGGGSRKKWDPTNPDPRHYLNFPSPKGTHFNTNVKLINK